MNFSHEKCIAKCKLLWASRLTGLNLAGHMAKTFGMKQSFYNHQIIVKHLTSVLIFVVTKKDEKYQCEFPKGLNVIHP